MALEHRDIPDQLRRTQHLIVDAIAALTEHVPRTPMSYYDYTVAATDQIELFIDLYRSWFDRTNIQLARGLPSEEERTGVVTIEPEGEAFGGLSTNIHRVGQALEPIIIAAYGGDISKWSPSVQENARIYGELLRPLFAQLAPPAVIDMGLIIDAVKEAFPGLRFNAQAAIEPVVDEVEAITGALETGELDGDPWFFKLLSKGITPVFEYFSDALLDLWEKLKVLIRNAASGERRFWAAVIYHVIDALWNDEGYDAEIEE